MRKLFIIIFLCLFTTPALAWSPAINAVVSGGGAATVQTDSCTGTLLFSWHCEDLDVTTGGVAGGVNNGCTVGADTLAEIGSGGAINNTHVKDGTYGCACPTTQDYLRISWANDFIDPNQGRIQFWIYFGGHPSANATLAFFPTADLNNRIYVVNYTGNVLAFYHKAGGTARSIITDYSLDLDTWYFITARWSKGKTGDGTNYLQVCLDTNETPSNCTSYSTSDLGTWAGTTGTLNLSTSDNYSQNFYFDKVKIYNHWSN
jgi:hypothetical protein